ncbi:NAD(P)/FAD-dependent oxidoreductase [Candidatus Babeliales bacterium]|nr:NAD(P)/FAD-dependent oxidoreductase [Candidatus Babeliales bacterium]
MSKKKALIIGAGPAGLTAAYELLQKTDVAPIVFEKSGHIGGISKTVNYKGNRIDIGGHRFFSKSDRVMTWWDKILPFQTLHDVDPTERDDLMLVRQRKSRIYFTRQFFDYPLKLTPTTIRQLGFVKTTKMGMSYMRSLAFPIRNEQHLEHFFINRFGRELYQTFFKSYTEKVWGIECDKISPEWGAQRIKGLSIATAIKHFAKSLLPKETTDVAQKETETTLIEQFLYPKYGPGQMWEEVARQVHNQGGQVLLHRKIVKIHSSDGKLTGVDVLNSETNEIETIHGDYVFSTMPVQELIESLGNTVPDEMRMIGSGLMYRDFITVGLLCNKLKIRDKGNTSRVGVRDNWIYIQEPDVTVGRLQIFNNWSPYMVADPETAWIGLEYFCQEGDELWNMKDHELIAFGAGEMEKIGILNKEDVLDGTVLRVEKTYPAYFGTYNRFDELRSYLDTFSNLFLIGRNGMHRYNNQDHSMLTAMTAVDSVISGDTSKSHIWSVNTEKEYHEEK